MPRVGKSFFQFVQLVSEMSRAPPGAIMLFESYNPRRTFILWKAFLTTCGIGTTHNDALLESEAPHNRRIKFVTHEAMKEVEAKLERLGLSHNTIDTETKGN